MKLKIRKNLSGLDSLMNEVSRTAVSRLEKPLKERIIKDITSKVSPVQGQRFSRYSENSKKRGLINLRDTGQFYRSMFIKTKNTSQGSKLFVGFNPYKKNGKTFNLAEIHNSLGAGRIKKISRILPTESGETFNRSLTSFIQRTVDSAIKSVIARFSLRRSA
jgi:hypothetical protein